MIDIVKTLFSILILGVVVERIVELLHASKFFLPLRNRISLLAYPSDEPPLESFSWIAMLFGGKQQVVRRLSHFGDTVLGCGYCTSVWVAMLMAHWCPLPFEISGYFGWIIRVVLLHGVSNYYHVLYEQRKKWATHPTPFHLMVDVRNIENIENEVVDNEVDTESEGLV